MTSTRLLALLCFCVSTLWGAGTIPGNAENGERLFAAKQCNTCHTTDGSSSAKAPNLAEQPPGRLTPSSLAAAIWSHGPEMWTAMEKAGVDKREISYGDAADLYAYIFSLRRFEEPGNAANGQRLFEAKDCDACHMPGGNAAPVSDWESVDEPIQLARAMWNHAARMRSAMSEDAEWPILSGQDLADLLAYVRGQTESRPTEFTPASAETGEMLFQVKNCTRCHGAGRQLVSQRGPHSLTGLAAAMWNHAPEMRDSSQELLPEEMTRLVGYLWSIQYFDGVGDPAAGLQAAMTNGCVDCHGDPQGNAPRFTSFGGKADAMRFISGSWTHAAGMRQAMQEAGKQWPQLTAGDVQNIVAYMNSLQ